MRIFLVIIGIWLLINILFVVIMMPPRKPRKADPSRASAGLAPAAVERNAYPFDEEEKVSLRHTIIAIAMGTLFSLTPPLLQAVDDIKRLVRKYFGSDQPSGPEGSEERKTADESPSDARNGPKH